MFDIELCFEFEIWLENWSENTRFLTKYEQDESTSIQGSQQNMQI